MSMSILQVEEQRTHPSLPPLSGKRLRVVLALAACLFIATVVVMRQLMPGPRTSVEYMLMGTVGMAAALLTVLIAVMRSRRKFFVPPDDEQQA